MSLTVQQIDAALANRDLLTEDQVALLWAARAGLLGVEFRAAHLVYLMGVTPQRAAGLEAVLLEHGLIETDG